MVEELSIPSINLYSCLLNTVYIYRLSKFHPLVIVDRGSDTQFKMSEKLCGSFGRFQLQSHDFKASGFSGIFNQALLHLTLTWDGGNYTVDDAPT